MDLRLSTEQEILRDSALKFVERECPPDYIRELDGRGEYPWELDRKMADQGWFGLPLPEAAGGSGLGPLELVLLVEALSRYSVDVGGGYGETALFLMDLLEYGNEAQRGRYLVPILEGRLAVSSAQVEPFSNEDLEAIGVRAMSEGSSFLLEGEGVYVPKYREEDVLISVPTRSEIHGVTLFLVSLPVAGVRAEKLDIMGRRILGLHRAGFDGALVDGENCLGGPGSGSQILGAGANRRVLLSSAGYVGNAQTAVTDALEYAKQRHQFGRPIGSFQAIGHMLADMQTWVDASRLLVYSAAAAMEQERDCSQEVAIGKCFSSETYAKVTNQGIHIMGGYGYMKEYDMQRYARDAQIATTDGWTMWHNRNTVARGLGLYEAAR